MTRDDRTGQTLRHRKTRDRAMILPVAGFLLLMPPAATIFDLDTKLAGLPFTLVYVFGVWVLLIGGAWAISARLGDDDEAAPHETGPVDGP